MVRFSALSTGNLHCQDFEKFKAKKAEEKKELKEKKEASLSCGSCRWVELVIGQIIPHLREMIAAAVAAKDTETAEAALDKARSRAHVWVCRLHSQAAANRSVLRPNPPRSSRRPVEAKQIIGQAVP